MITLPFTYRRASSVDEALAMLAATEGGKLVAGGHSLVPLMKLRLSEPRVLIDVARIPELTGIREVDGAIEIGACATHHQVATSALVRARCGVVAEAAATIGDPQVRNRGTLGGSLAHGDPAADYPAPMLAVDAELHIRGPQGTRTVRAERFFQGFFTVDLGPTEMLVAVRLPAVRAAAYAKLYQRASHFPIVGVAAALDVRDGHVASARVAVTGAGTHASRLAAVEEALAGSPATPESFARAAGEATLEYVTSDLHGSEDYRRAMMAVFTRRALEGALARAS